MDDAGGLPVRPPMRFCPHCAGKLDDAQLIEWSGWTFNEETGMLTPGNVKFTKTEGAIVGTLLRRGGKICRRNEHLYSAICAARPDADWPEIKIVDVLVCKIRRKLRAANIDMIDNTWGVGYFAVAFDPSRPIRPLQVFHIPTDDREPSRNAICKCGHPAKAHVKYFNNRPMNRRRQCRNCLCKSFEHKEKQL